MGLEQLAAVACVLLLCWYLIKTRSRLPNPLPGTRHPPCLPALPVAGSLPFLKSDPRELAHQLMEKSKSLGSVFALYFGSTYIVVLNSTDSIRDALLKKSSHFGSRSPYYVERNYLNTNLKGVAFAPYDDAFRRKHQLYLSILKKFGFGLSQMEAQINSGVEKFITKAKTTKGHSFDPNAYLELSILNIIASIIFGDHFQYGNTTLSEANDLAHNWLKSFVLQIDYFPLLRFVPPYRGLKNWAIQNHQKLLNIIDGMVSDVLSTEKSDANTSSNDSFVHQFIESTKTPESNGKPTTTAADRDDVERAPSGVNFDREELTYTVRDLLAGGSDTSVTTVRWFLMEMANNREVQTRMQKEIDNVVGWDRLPLLADEKYMPYSQAVLMETMRRHTLAPIPLFRLTTCDTSVGELFVPAGVTVLVNLYSAHMDPTEWEDPHVFRPERFIDASGEVYGKDRVIPFTLGKRSCLGETLARQELFLFMTGIVQNFDVRPPDGVQQIPTVGRTVLVYEPLPFDVRLISRVRE